MRDYKYILVDKKPVVAHDLLAWAQWFETGDRHVRQNQIRGARVSTVFLGIDHNWSQAPGSLPILFETMIFDLPKFEGYQERYSTWEQALEGHREAVRLLVKYFRRKKRAKGP